MKVNMRKFLFAGMMGAALLAAPHAAQAGHDTGYCREYTKHITIGGRGELGYGKVCLQEDGSWKVVFGQDEFDDPPPRYREVRYVERRPEVVYVYERPRYYRFVPPGHWKHSHDKWDRHRHGDHDGHHGHHGRRGWDD